MIWNLAGAIVALCIAATLTACGGGGGGGGGGTNSSTTTQETSADQANAADGLGSAGHASGTVDLGAAAVPGGEYGSPLISIALSDEARALAVWQVTAPVAADTSAAWAQSSDTGIWSASTPLPQVHNVQPSLDITLRMNQAGNAVLGWVSYGSAAPENEPFGFRVSRFIQGSGWDSHSYDASGASGSGSGTSAYGWSYNSTQSWDLTMLDDNSFTSTVRTQTWSDSTSGVQRTDIDGKQTIALQSTIAGNVNYNNSAYTVKPSNGYGLLYQLAFSESQTGAREVRARLASIYSGAFRDFLVGTYPLLCYTESYDGALIGVVTPRAEGVLAVLSSDGGNSCQYHNLQLSRVYTASSIRVESTRLNTTGTVLPVAPALVADESGNALVVWKESTGNSSTPNQATKLMWSQSLYGGPWSPPSSINSNLSTLGSVRRDGHIALAMNAHGEAIVSIKVDGVVNPTVNPSIVISSFSFEKGWTPWRTVANKQRLSEPKVAINASGQAVVAYTALPALRVNGQAPVSISSKDALAHAFAYRF